MEMKPRPKIKCRKCNGKGRVELDPILFGTLHVLTEFKSATAQHFFDELKEANISITAYNKRLERLRKAGLVKRQRDKKTWYIHLYENTGWRRSEFWKGRTRS